MAPLRITLRPGERIFVNGAVLRTERKTTLEFMNDVTFLLESHVIQPEDARTPLRRLYYTIQTMLIEPGDCEEARRLFARIHGDILSAYANRDVIDGLEGVRELVEAERGFEALKALRGLIPVEDAILGVDSAALRPSLPRKSQPAPRATADETRRADHHRHAVGELA